jgi:hypothetical protein
MSSTQPSVLRNLLQSPDYTGAILKMMEEASALSNEIFELEEVFMTMLFDVCIQTCRRTC